MVTAVATNAVADGGVSAAVKTGSNVATGKNWSNDVWETATKDAFFGGFGTTAIKGTGAAWRSDPVQNTIAQTTSAIKDVRLNYALQPLRKEFGTNIDWQFVGNNIAVKEAKYLTRDIRENPMSRALLNELNLNDTQDKFKIRLDTTPTSDLPSDAIVRRINGELDASYAVIRSQEWFNNNARPINISLHWDVIKNQFPNLSVPSATSKLAHELTHGIDYVRIRKPLNRVVNEIEPHLNEALALKYSSKPKKYQSRVPYNSTARELRENEEIGLLLEEQVTAYRQIATYNSVPGYIPSPGLTNRYFILDKRLERRNN